MAEDKFAFISVVLPLRTCLADFLLMSNPCGSFMLILVLKENSFCKFFSIITRLLRAVLRTFSLFITLADYSLWFWYFEEPVFANLLNIVPGPLVFIRLPLILPVLTNRIPSILALENCFCKLFFIAWLFRTCLKDFISICRILADSTPFDSDTGKIPFSFPLSVSGTGTCPLASS